MESKFKIWEFPQLGINGERLTMIVSKPTIEIPGIGVLCSMVIRDSDIPELIQALTERIK
jgi:hypothetical protein